MEFEQTNEFKKDIKKLSAGKKKRLKKQLETLPKNPESEKALRHLKNVFSIRIGNKRLIYKFKPKEDTILLLFYKGREDVYELLR